MSNPSNQDTAATLEYHEATKHSERSLRSSRHYLDWENQPLSFKIYRDLEAIPLPQPFPDNELPALEAISPAVDAPLPDLLMHFTIYDAVESEDTAKRRIDGEISQLRQVRS